MPSADIAWDSVPIWYQYNAVSGTINLIHDHDTKIISSHAI